MRFKLLRVALAVSAILSTAGFAAEGRSAAPDAAGSYLGQEPPGEVPVVFAPGIVSQPEYTEWSGTFASNDSEYYFYRFSGTSPATIYQSMVVDTAWTDPEPVSFSARYPAYEPCLTYDGAALYFAWAIGSGFPGIWVTTRDTDGWVEPQLAGQGMFVSSDSMGNIYVTDMSSVMTNGKTYLAKVTLNNRLFAGYQRLNISAHYGTQAHPCIARDGSYIIFDVNGGSYMYVSFRNPDSTWGEAIDLTAHGFAPQAGGATLSPDGKYLFFHLNGDIWWVDAQVIENLRPVPSCCVGTTGNVNETGITDLADLSMLVAYLTVPLPGKPTLPCVKEANVNTAGIIDLADLSMLVAYLTVPAPNKPVLPNCP